MQDMPRSRSLDSTHQFLHDPYRFISRQSFQLKSDVFEARLLLEKIICMTGSEAAEIFSNEELFERRNALPEVVASTLVGKHGVQSLDREAHFLRKQMFLSLLGPEHVKEFQKIMLSWLKAYTDKWMQQSSITLYHELQEILARSVFMWVGLELSEDEVEQRTEELTLLFDRAGSIKDHLKVRRARKSLEHWMEKIIEEIRNESAMISSNGPLSVIANFRDINGNLLSLHDAAVEAINLLRPPLAVSVYLVLCMHALHLHPASKCKIKAQEAGYLDFFVNEVRRFYPFFPSLFAKVKEDFTWKNMTFKKGTRAILDLYGINHDERNWERPFEFHPERFRDWKGSRFTFVPQGIGDHALDHRCPGELLTIELMRTFTEYMVMNISYVVPEQNLVINMNRLPALPEDKFMMTNILKQFEQELFQRELSL